MQRSRHDKLTAVLLGAAALGLAACSATADEDASAVAPTQETIAIAPGETLQTSTTVEDTTTTAPTTTAAPVTEAPVTEPPTTQPETTTAPSTTVKPRKTTTTTTLPRTMIPVPPMKQPLVAMGQSSGSETTRMQERLLELGYWLSGADGSYGLTTTQAVMAFQKYSGLEASGYVDQATADAISAADLRVRGRSDTGDLIEVDKQRQLLFVVRDGITQWVFNTSTGSGEEYTEPDKNTPGESIVGVSLTPNGLYRVDRERPEGWWEGDLGEIYRPKYFRGGIAVHGSNSIPNYPASHGCVRLSVPAMDFIWDANIMPMSTTVWVHEGV